MKNNQVRIYHLLLGVEREDEEQSGEDPFIFSWEHREKMKNNQVRIPSSSPGSRERR